MFPPRSSRTQHIFYLKQIVSLHGFPIVTYVEYLRETENIYHVLQIFCVLDTLLGSYHRLSHLILMINISNRHYYFVLQRWELRLQSYITVPNSIPKIEPNSLQILKLPPAIIRLVIYLFPYPFYLTATTLLPQHFITFNTVFCIYISFWNMCFHFLGTYF